MGNLDKWDKLARPPEAALKSIKGGRLKGMTDINPQWRYKALTDVYGPCGGGWKFTIDRLWTEPGTDGQLMAFAQISLYVAESIPVLSTEKYDDLTKTTLTRHWSESIPGIGGSMLITKEQSGLHTSDEAFKMAVTDALSVAAKMLGVGADIYMGRWDGSKYKDQEEKPNGKTNPAKNALGKKPYSIGDGITISKEREGELEGVIARTLKWCSEQRWADALLEMDNNAQDNEEKLFMWSFLNSAERSAVTKEVAAQKAKYMNEKQGEQA